MSRPGSAAVVAAALLGALLPGLAPPAAAAPPAAQTAAEPDRVVSFTAGGLQALEPARLLDTRSGGRTVDGAHQAGGQADATAPVTLQVAGRAGVPAAGAGAVVLNVTVTAARAGGHLTVHPTGSPLPQTSSINFARGSTVPGLVVAKLGRDGRIDLTPAAPAHLLADVVAWLPEGRDVQTVAPARLLDTRRGGQTVDGRGQAEGPVAASSTRRLAVNGRAGVPAVGVGAVVVNITSVGATAAGFVTAYPSGTPRPDASTLNLAPGQTVANLAIAKVGADGALALYGSATTHLLVDVVAWLPDDAGYVPLAPARVLDTRRGGRTVDGRSQAGGALPAGAPRLLQVAGRAGVPATGVGAVVVNLTGTGASAPSTHLTVYPGGSSTPDASSLNLVRGQTRANLAVAKLGSDGSLALENASGATHVLVDVLGWFPTGTAGSAGDSGEGSVRMVLPPTSELVGSGDVVVLEGTAATPTAVVLAPGADVPPVGGHLVALPHDALPDGVLAVVTGATPLAGGRTRLAVRRAGPTEAFRDLDVAYDGPVELQDRQASSGASGPSGTGLTSARTAEGAFGFGPVTGQALGCLGSVEGSADFSAQFTGTSVEFDLDTVERTMRLLVTTVPTASLKAALAGSAQCKRTFGLPGKLPLGSTGFFLDADLELELSLSGELAFQASVATPLQMGFEYTRGAVQQLSGLEFTGSAGFEGTLDVNTTEQIEPSVLFALEYLGLGGITVELALPVTAVAFPRRTPCATLDVAGRITVRAFVDLPFVFGIDKDLGEVDLGRKQVWSGTCGTRSSPTPGPTATAPPTSSPTGPPAPARDVDLDLAVEVPPYSVVRVLGPNGANVRTTRSYAADVRLPRFRARLDDTVWSTGSGSSGPLEARSASSSEVEQYSSPDGQSTCRTTSDDFRPTGWDSVLFVQTRDKRPLDRASPGETVYVVLRTAVHGTDSTSASGRIAGEDCSFGPERQPASLPADSDGDRLGGTCSADTVRIDFSRPGSSSPNEICAVPAVVRPDGGVSLDRVVEDGRKQHGPDGEHVYRHRFSLHIGPATP